MRSLRALDIREERALAGRVAGLLYLVGAATACVLPLLPGTEVSDLGLLYAIAGGGALWGVACLTVVPWKRVHPVVSHLSSGMGLPITVAAMALTGGATSPARFYLFFVVFYTAYFYPPREAVPYLMACIATLQAPLLYDSGATEGGALGELIVVVPTYIVLATLIMSGKRVLVELREEAHELSMHDALTGLWNRRAFRDRLAEHVGGRRSSDAIGLMLVDLDAFKNVNTKYGHPAGDRVLCETAAALARATRAEDLLARLGGDEFAILVRDADEETMTTIADRVLDGMRETDWSLDLPDFRLRASLGWALHPQHGDTAEELVAAADHALRQAKARGKDQWLGSPAA